MKTNDKRHPVFACLTECVPTAETILVEYGEVVSDTLTARLQWVCDTFKAEYCFSDNLKRYGSYQRTFAEWLQGLPSALSVDYENHRIRELAIEWGSLRADDDDRALDKILDNWYNFISVKFYQLCKQNKVKAW